MRRQWREYLELFDDGWLSWPALNTYIYFVVTFTLFRVLFEQALGGVIPAVAALFASGGLFALWLWWRGARAGPPPS